MFLGDVLLLIAACLLLYPLVANNISSHEAAQVTTQYNQTVSKLDAQQIQTKLAQARAYNAYLYQMSRHLSWTKTIPNYSTTLKLGKSDLMGYLSIPQIRLSEVPIYHGDASNTLAVGIGHIEGTSLPVGGLNTHALLTAHSGRLNDNLFTDLDKLKIGDTFTIDVLNQHMKYQIYRREIVRPDDTSHFYIEKGQDIVTLVTCWPTGVNSYRLLVTGKRVAWKAKTPTSIRNAYGYSFWAILVVILILCLIFLIPLLRFLWYRRQDKAEIRKPALPWYYKCPLFLALAKRRKKDDEKDEEAPERKEDEDEKDTTSER